MPHLVLGKILDGAQGVKKDGAAYLINEELDATAFIALGAEVLQVAKLVVYGARKRYRRIWHGKPWGYRERRVPVGVREIARILGISKSRVHRIIARIEG